MSYLRRVDGIRAEKREFSAGPQQGDRVDTHVWVFTDGLVVTLAPRFTEPLFPNAMKALEGVDLATLEPDTITDVCPNAVHLDRERVCRVDYAGPRRVPLINRRFGGFHAYFFFADESWFQLIVPPARGDEVWTLLQETYPDKAHDFRDDL